MSHRKKWGKHKQHHILASNSARASLTNQTPFFLPFPFPSPFHITSQFHHSPPQPQLRKRWLTLQASKRHVVSERFRNFLIGVCKPHKLYADGLYLYEYTYLQAPRNKVFRVILPLFSNMRMEKTIIHTLY